MRDNDADLRVLGIRLTRMVLVAIAGLGASLLLRAADPSTSLTQARELHRAGNLDAAAEQIHLALAAMGAGDDAPLRAALHRELAEVRIKQKRFQEAAGHFEQSLRAEPGQGVVHYQAGLAYLQIGKTADAAAHLDQAVELGFRNTAVLFHLAGAHFASGQNAAGLERSRELLSMNLTSPDFLFRLGRLLFQYFFYRDALKAFEAAIAISPPSYELRFFTALTNYLLNRHEEAVRLLEALDDGEAAAESSSLLASALAQQDRFVEAEALFQKTIERYSKSPHAYLNLAFVLLEQGKTTAAEGRLDDLRRLGNTTSPKVFYSIRRNSCAAINEKLGEEAEPASNPERAQAFFDLAQGLSGRHHDGTAIELLRLARRYEGNTPRTLYAVAFSCLNLDADSAAPVGILQRLLLLDPASHAARYLLGRALVRQGKQDKAIVLLRRAVELDPQNAAYHTELGRALLTRNEQGRSEALEAFSEAARLDSANVIARYELGKILMSQDRFPEATRVLEEAIKVEPEFYEAYYVLGQLNVRTGERETARKYLRLFREKLGAAKARSTVGEGFSSSN